MKDVERVRSEDRDGEFFVIVVGDNQNKYFKVKSKFFKRLFGESRQYEFRNPSPPPKGEGRKQTSIINAYPGSTLSPSTTQREARDNPIADSTTTLAGLLSVRQATYHDRQKHKKLDLSTMAQS